MTGVVDSRKFEKRLLLTVAIRVCPAPTCAALERFNHDSTAPAQPGNTSSLARFLCLALSSDIEEGQTVTVKNPDGTVFSSDLELPAVMDLATF